jgi:hypothetical protein
VAYYIVENHRRNRWLQRMNRSHADIAAWVSSTFRPTRVGDATVYDLAAPK